MECLLGHRKEREASTAPSRSPTPPVPARWKLNECSAGESSPSLETGSTGTHRSLNPRRSGSSWRQHHGNGIRVGSVLMRDRRRTAASGSPRSPIAHGGMTNGMSGSPAAVMVVDPPGHAPSRRAGKLQNQPSVEVPHLTERVGHQRLIGHVLSPGRIGGGLGPPRWRGERDRAEQAALGDGGP